MYYQNYEDYMRSVLGYPIEPTNTYESYDYLMSPYERSQAYSNQLGYNNEILELYPDIYRVVNPMVCKICENNTNYTSISWSNDRWNLYELRESARGKHNY